MIIMNQAHSTYELMVILDPQLLSDQLKNQIETLEKFIAEIHGNIITKEEIGLRGLAYRIKKKDQGFYLVYYLTSPGAKIAEFERFLRLERNCLRYLIIKKSPQEEYQKFQEMINTKQRIPEEKAIVKEALLPNVVTSEVNLSEPRPETKTPKKEKKEIKKSVAENPSVEPEKKEQPLVSENPQTNQSKKSKKPESLESIDKKLESFLENPTIDI